MEAAEDLKLLEAETAELRGKLPLRQAALKAARHEGEAGEGGEKGRGGSEDLSEKSSSLLCIFFIWVKEDDCMFIFKAICECHIWIANFGSATTSLGVPHSRSCGKW